MYINATGFYIPEQRIPNSYYTKKTGVTEEWLIQRTGIKTRARAQEDENFNTMGLEAVKNTIPSLKYEINDVDLIVSATYSPFDTVGTAAHVVQHSYGIENVKAFTLSSACSSFINALEIVEGYFACGKAQKALIIGGDKNSAYSNEDDVKAGHLWGDAAVAFFISKEQTNENDYKIMEIYTEALGTLGKGPEGIQLRPRNGGIQMPEGKDVFIQACTYMPKNAIRLLTNNSYTLDDLDYFIGHQANLRILKNIANNLGLSKEKVLTNIEELGNTGSASCALVFAQHKDKFKKNDLVCMSVFGGGYSAGSCLIRI